MHMCTFANGVHTCCNEFVEHFIIKLHWFASVHDFRIYIEFNGSGCSKTAESSDYYKFLVPWLEKTSKWKKLAKLVGLSPRQRESILDTAQKAVTIARICAHSWAQQKWQERYSLSVCISCRIGHIWALSNCPYAPTTPPIHFTTISWFLSNFFPRMAPQLFWYTIHQGIWPSPGTLSALWII